MTDKQQPEVLRSLYEITGNITDHNTALVNIAELETLREKLKTYEDLGDARSDMQLLRTGIRRSAGGH